MRRLAAMFAVALATVTVLALAPPASPAAADTFGGCYGASSAEGCVPDNFNHWMCLSGTVDANFQNAINGAMLNLDNQTSYARFSESPVSACNSLTDLVWMQVSGIGARGDYSCLAFNNEGECERARLRLNPDVLTNAANRLKTACHELGHSVGLKHGISGVDNTSYVDCMRSGAITSGFNNYDAHHVTHANNGV